MSKIKLEISEVTACGKITLVLVKAVLYQENVVELLIKIDTIVGQGHIKPTI